MNLPENPSIDNSGNYERAPKIKDSWLQAVVDGYALWPGKLTPGISILVTEAVLNDPPENWHDFLSSTLSAVQIDNLSQKLQPYYQDREIPYDSDRGIPSLVTMEENRLPDGNVAFRENNLMDASQSLQLLWFDTTDIVANTLLDVIHGSRFDDDGPSQGHIVTREMLFADEGLVAKIPTAKRTIAAAKEGLLSQEGRELAELSRLGGWLEVQADNPRHKTLLKKYMKMEERLHPYEESKKMLALAGLTPLTNREIFSRSKDLVSITCAQLANFVIQEAVKKKHLPAKFSAWTTY